MKGKRLLVLNLVRHVKKVKGTRNRHKGDDRLPFGNGGFSRTFAFYLLPS